jgi:hypothetical protein
MNTGRIERRSLTPFGIVVGQSSTGTGNQQGKSESEFLVHFSFLRLL